MTIPAYLPYYVLIGAIATIATILFGLRNALAKAAWSKHERATAFRFSAIILVGWFLLAFALGTRQRLIAFQRSNTASSSRS